MKIENIEIITPATVVATSLESKTVWIGHIAMLALQFKYSGATTATIKVQASCDAGYQLGQTQQSMTANVTTWTDVPSATTASLSGAGTALINIVDPGYQWIRLVVTGAITIDSARMNAKGI